MADRNRSTDILFSKFIRKRAGKCERCHRGAILLECAHIIRRRYLRTRWHPSNAWSLCKACHYEVDNDELEFAHLVDRTIGRERFRELKQRAHAMDLPKPDRAAIRKHLRSLLAELEEAAA